MSCLATACWCLSPVPVSPMTANFTEPFFIGSVTFRFCAVDVAAIANANATIVSTNKSERRMITA